MTVSSSVNPTSMAVSRFGEGNNGLALAPADRYRAISSNLLATDSPIPTLESLHFKLTLVNVSTQPAHRIYWHMTVYKLSVLSTTPILLYIIATIFHMHHPNNLAETCYFSKNASIHCL